MSGNNGTNDPEHEQSDVRPAESGPQATPDSNTAGDASAPTEQFTAVTRAEDTGAGRSGDVGGPDAQKGGEQADGAAEAQKAGDSTDTS
ncbi:hypothetical protein, partial [Rhodococcus chondri]